MAVQTTSSLSVKVLVTCQFFHFFVITLFYGHSVYEINRIEKCVARKNQSAVFYEFKPRIKRETVAPVHPDDLSQWTILLGHDTIIPVSFLKV